jgi:hypothetical protein
MTPKAQRGKKEQAGVLAGHYRQGRIYRTGFTAIEVFRRAAWARDDLPDLLLPILLLATQGDSGIRNLVRAQAQVLAEFPELFQNGQCRLLDGRLTGLDSVPLDSWARTDERLLGILTNLHAIPEQFVMLYHLYPDMPGAWLLHTPESEQPSEADKETFLGILAQSIYAVLTDGHLEAMVKAVPLFWSIQSGQGSIDPQFHEILRGYPNPASPSLADTMIRASFGASRGRDEQLFPTLAVERQRWAAGFWRQNWRLTNCMPAEFIEDEAEAQADGDGATDSEPSAEADTHDGTTDEDIYDLQQSLVEATSDLMNQFLRATWAEAESVDLWEPAKHEVVTGLVNRAGRAVLNAFQAPDSWNGEHLSDVTRKLVETEIYLSWMQLQDPAVYDRYQKFGIGKRKLNNAHLKRVLSELPPELRPPAVEQAVRHNESKMGGPGAEDFIDVSTESFMGKTMRTMADEAGLLALYNLEYQTLSGNNHGEWWAIEDYAMQRCLNPLHRGHQIASLEPFPTAPTAPQLLVNLLDRVVHLAQEQLVPTVPDDQDPNAAVR